MVNLWLLVTQIVGMAVAFGLVIFLSAGSLSWLPGWIYLGLMFGFVIAISIWLLLRNPSLLRERMTGVGAKGQKSWDKALLALIGLLFVGWLAVMPADAVRFQWTSLQPFAQALGALLLVGSFPLFFWVFAANPYLSPAVRLQKERDHRVVSSGPWDGKTPSRLRYGQGAELRMTRWSVADALCRAAARLPQTLAPAKVGPAPRKPRVAAAARCLPAARRTPPAPRWGSVFLVAARTNVARLAFAAAVRPARDRDSVASHRVTTVLDRDEPQTSAWSASN